MLPVLLCPDVLTRVVVSVSVTTSVRLSLPVSYRLSLVVPADTMSEDPSVIVWPSVVVRVDGSSRLHVSVIVPVSNEVSVEPFDEAAVAVSPVDKLTVVIETSVTL